jgi:hypothetical protein
VACKHAGEVRQHIRRHHGVPREVRWHVNAVATMTGMAMLEAAARGFFFENVAQPQCPAASVARYVGYWCWRGWFLTSNARR